jgi:hypothetical protein
VALRRKSGLPVRVDPEVARVAALCRACGLAPPILGYEGFDAVFHHLDLALIISDGPPDRRRVNRAAVRGWFVLWVSAAEWRDGAALDLVKKAARCLG